MSGSGGLEGSGRKSRKSRRGGPCTSAAKNPASSSRYSSVHSSSLLSRPSCLLSRWELFPLVDFLVLDLVAFITQGAPNGFLQTTLFSFNGCPIDRPCPALRIPAQRATRPRCPGRQRLRRLSSEWRPCVARSCTCAVARRSTGWTRFWRCWIHGRIRRNERGGC